MAARFSETPVQAELRQTVRVTVAVAAAYAIYKLLDLQQGYWAVFTVLIVMQGSIGSTLGAAIDRPDRHHGRRNPRRRRGGDAYRHNNQLGPRAGAGDGSGDICRGSAATAADRLGHAAILLLSAPPEVQALSFVIDRIVEIAIGGVIGVLATVCHLFPPARMRVGGGALRAGARSASRNCWSLKLKPSNAARRWCPRPNTLRCGQALGTCRARR